MDGIISMHSYGSILFNRTFVRIYHCVPYNIFHLLSLLYNIAWYDYPTDLFIHSVGERHCVCFKLSVIKNNAVMNIPLHIFW